DPSAGAVTTGAAGATESTVNVLVFEIGPVFPAASVAVADTVCAPSASAVAGVKVQAPEPSASVVPTTAPSMRTFTVAPGSAVPLMGGVVSFVRDPSAGVTTAGAAGGVRSTVNATAAD